MARNNLEIKQRQAEQEAKDAQFAAQVAFKYYHFLLAHQRDNEGALSSCEANRITLEEYINTNLLDASAAESWEIALLAVGRKLVRTAVPQVIPQPVAPAPPPPVEQLSESDQLRQLLRDNKGATPREIANLMRAQLRTGDVHGKQAAQILPPTITKQDILAMSPERQRYLTSRYGAAALNNRLKGIN